MKDVKILQSKKRYFGIDFRFITSFLAITLRVYPFYYSITLPFYAYGLGVARAILTRNKSRVRNNVVRVLIIIFS